MTMLQSSSTQAAVYNTLLPITEANRDFYISGGDEAVDALLTIIATAGLEDIFGVRLLHKHNDISDSELMIELDEFDEEGFALVTVAKDVSSCSDYICNCWSFTENNIHEIEYSKATLIKENISLSRYSDFVEKFRSKLIEMKVEQILGLSVNYSAYVEAHSPEENAALLEKTDFDHRANVVRYVLRNDDEFKNSAKTKWHAKRIVDPSGRLSWMTACNCFCSVFPEGGHQGTTTHSYNP